MDHLWTPWRYAYVTGQTAAEHRRGVPPELSAWPGDTGCVFCNLIAATAYAVERGLSPQDADRAARIVARGPLTYIVLNAFPYNSGHAMVVPYEHTGSLAALPLATATEILTEQRRLERAYQAVYSPAGINFGLNLGQAAGAGIADHLHLHAVPRWPGDNNFMSVLGETRILPELLDQTWDKLMAALAAVSSEQ